MRTKDLSVKQPRARKPREQFKRSKVRKQFIKKVTGSATILSYRLKIKKTRNSFVYIGNWILP